MTWIFCQWAISLIIELFTPQAGFLLIYNIRERVSGGMVYTFSCLRFQTEVQTGREESNKLPIYETVYSNWQYTGQWLTKWSPGPQAEPFWVLKISIRKLYRNRMGQEQGNCLNIPAKHRRVERRGPILGEKDSVSGESSQLSALGLPCLTTQPDWGYCNARAFLVLIFPFQSHSLQHLTQCPQGHHGRSV